MNRSTGTDYSDGPSVWMWRKSTNPIQKNFPVVIRPAQVWGSARRITGHRPWYRCKLIGCLAAEGRDPEPGAGLALCGRWTLPDLAGSRSGEPIGWPRDQRL